MKTNRIILTALAALCFAGCAKEIASTQEEQSVIKDGKTYVSVGETTLSKTVLDAADDQGVRKVYWQNGDCLNINGVDSKPLTGMGEKATNAVFEFDALLDFPYNVLYPASAWKDAGTVTLPSTQTYTADSFDPAAAVTLAAAASAGDKITLKSPCAVIKLSVAKDKDECVLKTLAFSGKAGEQVCGDFTADFANATLTGKSDAAADKTLKMDISSLTLGDEAKDIYIVVPAGTYASGFHIRISDVKGHFMDQDKSSSVTLAPGKVYSFPAITYTPTGTAVEIGTADEYLAFVDDFNKGVYGTKDATVSVEVLEDLDFTGKTFKTMGNANYEFSGTWHGNGKLMKNITATDQSMFYTPANATFTGIVIDASCSFTRSGANGGHWGIIARALDSGTISDCVINCDWNMDYGDGGFTYGCICGRLNGKMTNCHMNGNLIYNRTKTAKVAKYLWIGGIVGQVNTSGEMTNCSTTGNVVFNEPAEEACPTCTTIDQYFCVGGVVGKNFGKVSNCKMTGDMTYSDRPIDAFVGGVIGNHEGVLADNLTMEGNITAVQHNSDKSSGYKRLFVGGVVGRAWKGTVSNCTNVKDKKASISTLSENANIGGVIGSTGGTGTVVENLINNMTIEMNSECAYTAYVGGVCGSFGSGVTVRGAVNNGPVNVGVLNKTSSAQAHVGGVAGYCTTPIDGGTITNKVSSIHNTAQVMTNALHACTGFSAANFGGVIGRLDANATNLTNAGKVYMNFGDDSDQTNVLKYVSAGGVIGRVQKAVTVDGCVNTGNVQFRYWTSTANNAKINYVGGIAGSVMSLSASGGIGAVIRNCTSYGAISSSSNNNVYPTSGAGITQGKCEGGVIGVIFGTDSARATVENCSSASTTAHNAGYGYFGCVVGVANYTDIIGCSNTTNFTGTTSNGCTVGGILGITFYKVTVRNCSVKCKFDKLVNGGGICSACNTGGTNFATIESNTVDMVVTNCTTQFGAIARNPVAVTVLQDNGFNGSLNGTPFVLKNVAYTDTFTCDPSKPNYIITD